jgi:hypothetical protein
MIWLLFEALNGDGPWAFAFRNGEVYVDDVRDLPKGAKILRIGI